MSDNYTADNEGFLDAVYNVIIGAQSYDDGLEYTIPYLQDILAWFVPSAKPISRWRYLLTIFSFHIWFSWISIVFVVSSFIVFVEYLSGGQYSKSNFFTSIAISFKWFLEQSTKIKIRNTTSGKILIITTLYLSFMINNLFKSRVTYLLNGLNFEDSIDTYEKIFENELYIGCTPYMAYEIIGLNEKERNYLDEFYIECYRRSCINRTAISKDLASLTLSRIVRRIESFFVDPQTGQCLLKELPTPTYITPLVAIFNKGHPYFVISYV